MKDNKDRTHTEIFQHGYTAGYNQHRVECGEITQKEADAILQKILNKE